MLGWIFAGIICRIILESRVGFLKHYVYFNTPLTDLRNLFEVFNNQKLTGTYFQDHNAINQPLLIVRFYHMISDSFGLPGLKLALLAVDTLTVFL